MLRTMRVKSNCFLLIKRHFNIMCVEALPWQQPKREIDNLILNVHAYSTRPNSLKRVLVL